MLCNLEDYALISVRGADAGAFLQAQLSADILDLGANHSRLAAWCDAKGRMLALFRVTDWDENHLLLRVPAALLGATLPRLRMFVLRSRVEICDAAEMGIHLAGIAGEHAARGLEQYFGALPTAPGTVVRRPGAALIRVPDAEQRFELIAAQANWQDLNDALGSSISVGSTQDWQRREITAGLPEIWPQTRGLFVPQMVNLHWLGGVDFHKGCYPGQEIVARMQYLGKLKRRMYIARAASATVPPPGESVFAEGESQVAGNVVSAAPVDAETLILSAVLRTGTAQAPLHLGSETGPLLELQDLPYPMDEPEPAS